MGLTYVARVKSVEDIDLNFDGCNRLGQIHELAGLPLCPETHGVRRVPYQASADEVARWAESLARASCPRGIRWLQRQWLAFLRACGGYDAR